MRLIVATCVPVLAALALGGCGGGEATSVNSTALDVSAPTASTSGTSATSTSAGGQSAATTPSTGSATLSWVAPTQNSDGSSLTNLAGYNIYYGTDPSALTQTIQVTNASALSYVVGGLATGTTWYFAVTSYTAAGEESAHSATLRKTI